MSDARIFSIDEARGARSSGERRPRCHAETADGRPCRNYAVTAPEGSTLAEAGLCRVHAAQAAPAEDSDEIPLDRPAGGIDLVEGLQTVLGEDLAEVVAQVSAFLHRRATGRYEVDPFGFDRELTEQVLLPLMRPLYQRYWRVRSLGHDRLPDDGALIVANHAGTLPADALMVKLGLYDEAGRHLRMLGADLVWRTPFIGELGRKMGNTMACNEDARELLEQGELVGVWPEGFKGIGKLYRDRYKLQRFGRGGFVEVALRAQVPIVPTAIVGSEEIYPLLYNFKSLARLFGFPYFPVTWTFPWLGPLGLLPLPSKWIVEYGAPIDTREYGPEAADDPMAVFDLTDRVRDTIQQMLYRNLMGRRSIFF